MTYLRGGKVLRIDLSRRESQSVPTERYAHAHIGGRGLSARLLSQSDFARRDARERRSTLCFAAGVLGGTSYPGCTRTDVMWTSPAAGRVGRASMVGGWAGELKQAGWDAVVLVGCADQPVYVSIRNELVEIRDAGRVWGAACRETQDLIRSDVDSPDAKVACIGPAGESQMAHATVQSDLCSVEGAPGSGAVLGSKNCKAIAVRGTQGVRLADPGRFVEASLAAHQAVCSSEYSKQVHGYDVRDVPRAWELRRVGCSCCPVSCRENYRVPGLGGVVLPREARARLWTELRRRDPGLWYEFVRRCEEEGIDAAAMATTIRWLIRLRDLDLVPPRLADGVFVEGDGPDAMRSLLRATMERKGLGSIIAHGARATADYLDARIPAAARGGRSTFEHVAPTTGTEVPAGGTADAETDAGGAPAGAVRGIASAIGDIVGMCERLASATSDEVQADAFAVAISAGLGRTLSVDELVCAATRGERLELGLRGNAQATCAAVRPSVWGGRTQHRLPGRPAAAIEGVSVAY